ncbi:MAG: hypothetical protein NZ922_02935 [Candidatus Methanomethyliaceae archaeon]|nr:hypothetical protein [Candidatus Methanomethyliaceae archaeon]MDW7970818.1 hypothetical protein [Nitrososphaerota archaeon]
MVEGPTARAYSIKISNEFKDEVISEIFTRSKKVLIDIREIIGRKFSGATSLGKNILLFFEDIAIRIHLMLYGTIHIYRKNDELIKPKERARLIIIGNNKKLVVFNAPIIEINKKDFLIDNLRNTLGPDPLNEQWDEEKALKNLLNFPNEKIGVILLNQSIIAGIGNIIRNEILFRVGINPERKVSEISKEKLNNIVKIYYELSHEFLDLKLNSRSIREILMVYNKFNQSCKVCGNKIIFYIQQPIKRKTFVCSNCQR